MIQIGFPFEEEFFREFDPKDWIQNIRILNAVTVIELHICEITLIQQIRIISVYTFMDLLEPVWFRLVDAVLIQQADVDNPIIDIKFDRIRCKWDNSFPTR